jgi:hypothetical protein
VVQATTTAVILFFLLSPRRAVVKEELGVLTGVAQPRVPLEAVAVGAAVGMAVVLLVARHLLLGKEIRVVQELLLLAVLAAGAGPEV